MIEDRSGVALMLRPGSFHFVAHALRGLAAILSSFLLMYSTVLAQEVRDAGDFELSLYPVNSDEPDVRRVAHILAGERRYGLEAVVDDLNNELNLAEPVGIFFASWADIDEWAEANLADRPPGALFDRNGTDHIYISYEFMAKVLDTFEDDLDAWYLNVINVVLHEVGHALIHVNGIAAPEGGTDPERDADEVAFFVMAAFYEAEEQLHQVAEHYWRIAENALYEEYDHLPDQERAQRYECWVEGSFVGGPPHCVDTYLSLMDTWDELLAPSWKDPFGAY